MKRSIKLWLLTTALTGLAPLGSMADVFVSVSFAPPALPVYEQPVCPGDGYLWTPGYWAFADGAYYWVPGTWVIAPAPGLLWTPGYWAFADDDDYAWHPGYWGPQVGFYGGINYGYGYSGAGYQGGYWNHNVFNYNRTVNNINVTNVYNTYYSPVINNNPGNHVAYNGGAGGLRARPSAQEQLAMHSPHHEWTHSQLQNEQEARNDPLQHVSFNHAHPGVFATPTPAFLHGPGAVTQSRPAREPVELRQPVPHAPTVAYDPHGRGEIQRTSIPAQPVPEYRYTQDAPQSRHPVQATPVQYQHPAMPENDRGPQARPSWRQPEPAQAHPQMTSQAPWQARAPQPASPSYTNRDNRPQAYYPPTMAQRHEEPVGPAYRNSAPGEFRQTAQPAHPAATPQRPEVPARPVTQKGQAQDPSRRDQS